MNRRKFLSLTGAAAAAALSVEKLAGTLQASENRPLYSKPLDMFETVTFKYGVPTEFPLSFLSPAMTLPHRVFYYLGFGKIRQVTEGDCITIPTFPVCAFGKTETEARTAFDTKLNWLASILLARASLEELSNKGRCVKDKPANWSVIDFPKPKQKNAAYDVEKQPQIVVNRLRANCALVQHCTPILTGLHFELGREPHYWMATNMIGMAVLDADFVGPGLDDQHMFAFEREIECS